MGYDVKWLHNHPENSNIDLSDSIIISEQQVIQHLPIQKNAKYFIHNIKEDIEYVECEYDNIFNYLIYHEEYNNWKDVKQVEDFFWFDEKTKTPIIVWATDLLPDEIENIEPVLYDHSKPDVNFVGSVQGKNLVTFAHICADNGKNFYNLGGLTGAPQNDQVQFYDPKLNIDVVRNSYISIDIRESQHIRNGYIPCRVFKNISYGCWTGSNSVKLNKFLENYLTIESDLNKLYFKLIQDSSECSEIKIKNSMNYVMREHTYINRIKSLLSIL
jgi:hypothetical protein